MSYDPCFHSAPGKTCPITLAPCPGECVFADTLRNLRTGIVVLDVAHESLVFCNAEATTVLESCGTSVEFSAIRDLLVPNGVSSTSGRAQELRVGTRVLGATAYAVTEGFVWVFLRDITDQERFQAVAEAVNVMDHIGFIFSGIRHELGNPVNSIKMSLSVLKEHLERDSEADVGRYVDRALEGVGRVEYLLRSLKSFNMFEELQIEAIEPQELLQNVVRLVDGDLDRQGIAIQLSSQNGASPVVADPRALQQVLLNVISNASDAVAGAADPTIEISTGASNGLCTIRVVDNGHGIADVDLPNLFKPFHTSKENGTGLGLVIARKMLSRMRGQIEIRSRVGEGTEVAISLPAADHVTASTA